MTFVPRRYEFSALKKPQLTATELVGPVGYPLANDGDIVETRPHFHECAALSPRLLICICVRQVCLPVAGASVLPGMVCLARKKKTAVFRQYVAAETAIPVISCVACLPKEEEFDW